MRMRLLLLSNSTNFGGTFLGHATGIIQEFLGPVGDILFVPFAAVRLSYDEFAQKVRGRLEPLSYRIQGIHETPDPVMAVRRAKAIAVGGGNTFQLLKQLYDLDLREVLRERVRAGVPYVGWSAGANVAGPTVRTTNDMPIVEPPSLAALGLIPWQINPHYTDAVIPDHGGETRAERLLEFIAANPGVPVIGIREGSILRVEGDTTTLLGDKPARAFLAGREPWDVQPGTLPTLGGR
jgi:dipeptidase E